MFLAAIMVISVVAMSAAFAGAAAAEENDDEEIEWDEISDTDFWTGQTVTITGLDDAAGGEDIDAINLVEGTASNPGDTIHQQPGADEVTYGPDITEDLDGPYHIELEHEGESTTSSTMWWFEQEVTFEFDPAAVNEGGTTDLVFEEDNREDVVNLTISSDEIDFDTLMDVFHEHDDYDDEGEYLVFADQELGDRMEADVDGLDLGEYNVSVDVADSTASDEASFHVVEPVDADITVVDAEQELGDVLVGTFELHEASQINEVNLIIEDEYSAHVDIDVEDVTEDQEIHLYWNTYEAGIGPSDDHPAFWATDEDGDALDVDVTAETNIGDNTLPDTLYIVSAYLNDEDRLNLVDQGNYNINERHTGEISNWIAPADTESDAVLDYVTAHDEVAQGDLLVQEIDVSGIFGQAYDGTELVVEDIVDGDTFTLDYESQYDPTFDDQDTFDHEEVTFVADEMNNSLYAVVDTGAVENITDPMNEQTHDNPWDTTFTVNGPYLNLATDEDTESAEASFDVVDPVFELDPFYGEPYYMTPDENAEVRGSSTLAPGTEASLTINKAGVFNHPVDVEIVEDDGKFVWKHEADYSDRSVGEQFTLSSDLFEHASHGDNVLGEFAEQAEWDMVDDDAVLLQEIRDLLGVDDNDEIAGAIQDLMDERDDLQAQLDDANAEIDDLNNQIADLNDEIDDLQQQLDDAMADDNGDDNGDDDDDDGTPGFGVAVALVALLSAAMLALRRRD